MNKQEIGRLSNSQLGDLLNLESFERDWNRIKEILLNRNRLDSYFFQQLHNESGCNTESEFVYSLKSGWVYLSDMFEPKDSFFVRKCNTHGVESSEFARLGNAPEDWDGVLTSRRQK